MQTLRNFLIAFGAGLVIFGTCMFMILRMLGFIGTPRKASSRPDADAGFDPVASVSSETEKTRSANGFTMVIGGFDDRGELSLLMVAAADRTEERFMLSAIPTALRVRVPDENGSVKLTTLRALPTEFEGPQCKQKIVQTVAQITGLEADYYLFVDKEKALDLFNLTGGLYFDVPEAMIDIGTGTPEEPEVYIEKGGQVLGKQRILQLLTFEGYGLGTAGDSVRCAKIQTDFIDQALLQLGNLEDSTVNRIASRFLGDCDTDFTYDDYEFYFELIDRYVEYHSRNKRVYWDATDPIEEAYSKTMFETYVKKADGE